MVDTGLELAAAVGPFFVVEHWEPDAGWCPLVELIEQPDVLRERVRSARDLLAERSRVPVGEIEERAAASIVFMGLAARLVSPTFGAAVLSGAVPNLNVDSLWWRPVATGPWPLAHDGISYVVADDGLAAQLDHVFEQLITPIIDAFAIAFSVSRQVLWGNVASSLGGALTMLTTARPDHSIGATRLVESTLAHGTLSGTVVIDQPWSFRRTSCCLFYRMPGAGVCGDCVLDEAPPIS